MISKKQKHVEEGGYRETLRLGKLVNVKERSITASLLKEGRGAEPFFHKNREKVL